MERLGRAKHYSQLCKNLCSKITSGGNHPLITLIEETILIWLDKKKLDPSSPMNKKVVEIILAMESRDLRPYHEERRQLRALVDKVKAMWRTVNKRLQHMNEICIALTLVISAHAKNHKQDSIQAIVELSSEDFCSLFSTYYDAMELVLPMSTSTDWVDVYGEYTFAKLRTTYDPFIYQQRLSKFMAMFKEPVTITEFL